MKNNQNQTADPIQALFASAWLAAAVGAPPTDDNGRLLISCWNCGGWRPIAGNNAEAEKRPCPSCSAEYLAF